tara:strand:+ start:78 stop:263 length:186 start_codon:yes stop_codon:yes gene_type:complete
MTNKEIQKKLVSDMKKDNDLKQYATDIESLNDKQFKILINVFKKYNKIERGLNNDIIKKTL